MADAHNYYGASLNQTLINEEVLSVRPNDNNVEY